MRFDDFDIIKASSAVPVACEPYVVDGVPYFDGGIADPVPVQKALEDGEVLTDDCAAVERLGMKVSLTRGSRENIKITTPFDLLLGEAILEHRAGGVL